MLPQMVTATTSVNDSRGTEDKSQNPDKVEDVSVEKPLYQPPAPQASTIDTAQHREGFSGAAQ